MHGHLDSFSREQRRLVSMAIEAFSAIRSNNIGEIDESGAVVLRALIDLRTHVDWTLPEIRQEDATTTIARR